MHKEYPRCGGKKAQSSVEQTLVIGIGTLLVIPLLAVLLYYSQAAFDGIREKQVEEVGNGIMTYAGLVNSYGHKARMVQDFYFPKGMTNITIKQGAIDMEYELSGEKRHYARSLGFNANGNFSGYDILEGRKRLKFESVLNGSLVVIGLYRSDTKGIETLCIDNDDDGYYAYDPSSCTAGDDCDDVNYYINPGVAEDCGTSYDDNCDGLWANELYYIDSDGDGFGNISVSLMDCGTLAGYVNDNTDCNDNDASVNPAAPEACGEEKNCDGNPYGSCLKIIQFYDVLYIYEEGNAFLYGLLNENTAAAQLTPVDGEDEFVFVRSNGGEQIIVIINSVSREMNIKGSFNNHNPVLPPNFGPNEDNFIIINSNGDIVSYFDKNGNFHLNGTLAIRNP